MPSRRAPVPPPADWPPEKALLQVQQQLSALQQFKGREYRDVKAEHSEWVQQTGMILRHGFGNTHDNCKNFNFAGWAIGEYDRYEAEETKERLNFEARVKK